MNGSRYDQIRSTGVQKTYITISEGISYCIDWKIAFVWLLYQPSTPKIHNLLQYNTSNFINEIPKHAINNTFPSKLVLWATIKNVKSISEVNYIDSLHMKWCTLKNMGNWLFSLGHTLSHIINNSLRTAGDLTKIKTNLCRKHTELSMIANSNVSVEKASVWLLSQPPTPNCIISQYAAYDFLIIVQISEIYLSFLFFVLYSIWCC